MKKTLYKPLILLFISGTLFTCIDPFSPKLNKFNSLLVVDALLTDEDASNYVSLNRTMRTVDDESEKISGALVIIKDDIGNSTTLSEKSAGVYKTDSILFKGEVGRTYTLYIKTIEGDEYESEGCLMYPVQDIDSLYYGKDEDIIDTESQDGIRIYIDSKGDSDCRFYRWTYEEWWKFSVPDPKRFKFINDSTVIPLTENVKTCWGNKKSDEINISAVATGISNKFEKMPILFIAPDKSNRLLIQYCIEVKELSISDKEYEFWKKMQQLNESGGDLFDKQPFEVSSNIHNISKDDEKVLGYFQVSSARVKRLYITKEEISQLGIPLYRYECEKVEIGPVDFPPVPGMISSIPTFTDLYNGYINLNYVFIYPTYGGNGKLLRLAFVLPFCADCTLSGSLTKPDFWVDLD